MTIVIDASMNIPKSILRVTLGSLTLALGGLAGCQQGGFSAEQRDPIGPAPAGIPSPGIGAPGGQSVDTRGTGSIAGSEGEATLAGPSTPGIAPGPTR